MSVYTYQNLSNLHFEMCSLSYVSTTSIKFFFFNQCFPISHQIKPDFSAWYSSSLSVWHQLSFLVLQIKTLFYITHSPVKLSHHYAILYLLFSVFYCFLSGCTDIFKTQFKCYFLCEDYTDKGFPWWSSG